MCIVCKYMRSRGRARALNLYLPVTHCSFLFLFVKVNSILKIFIWQGSTREKVYEEAKVGLAPFFIIVFRWQVTVYVKTPEKGVVCPYVWMSHFLPTKVAENGRLHSGISSLINLWIHIEINLIKCSYLDQTNDFNMDTLWTCLPFNVNWMKSQWISGPESSQTLHWPLLH